MNSKKSAPSVENRLSLPSPLRIISAPSPALQMAAREKYGSKFTIAQMFSDARIGKGLSQEALATQVGVRQARISDLESCKGNPSIDTIDRVARVLDLELTFVPKKHKHTVNKHSTPHTRATAR